MAKKESSKAKAKSEDFEEIDFENLDEETSSGPGSGDDVPETVIGFLTMVHFKQLIFIFLIFLFVSSDVFINKVLNNISGAVLHQYPTTKGVFIQALIMVVLVILLDGLLALGFP